jgi:hypothetical protein
MNGSDVIAACRETLKVVLDGTPDEAALLRALDRLLAAYHDAPEAEPDDSDREPPAQETDTSAEVVAARWPELGAYAVADPLDADGPFMAGHAHDDLVDIASDLRKAIWRAENVGVADGLWWLLLMHFHWGRHARDLASYLHARRYEAERRTV